MSRAVDRDKRLSDSSDESLLYYANRIALPKTSFSGKVLQGTTTQDNRAKLAQSELRRRKKAKEGNKNFRTAGKDTPGGQMR